MSTITSDRRTSGWWHLMWKDYHLIRSAIATIVIAIVGLQIMLAISAWFNPARAYDLLKVQVYLGFLAPAFALLGCCGMLVGHEWQSGTWSWNSGLPIDWRHALISKLFFVFVVPIATALIVSVIPLVGLMNTAPFLLFQETQNVNFTKAWIVCIGDVLLGGTLCCLLLMVVRESIAALLSAIGLLVVYELVKLPAIEKLDMGVVVAMELVQVVLSLFVFAYIFRFRWQTSEQPLLSLSAWLPSRQSLPVRNPWPASQIRTVNQMHWILALSGNARLRLFTIFVCIVLMLAVPSLFGIDGPEHAQEETLVGPWIMLTIILVWLTGSTAFAGDQIKGRIQFLTDRGARPVMFVVSRLVSAALWCLIGAGLMALATSLRGVSFDAIDEATDPSSVPVFLAMFSVGALLSMCLRNQLVAIGLAVIYIIALPVTISALNFQAAEVWAFLSCIFVIVVSIAGVFYFARGLMKRGEVSAIHLSAYLLACYLIFLLAASTFHIFFEIAWHFFIWGILN